MTERPIYHHDQWTPEQLRERYDTLPDTIKSALYERSRLGCPKCGLDGVPIAWAMVVYDEMSAEIDRLRETYVRTKEVHYPLRGYWRE